MGGQDSQDPTPEQLDAFFGSARLLKLTNDAAFKEFFKESGTALASLPRAFLPLPEGSVIVSVALKDNEPPSIPWSSQRRTSGPSGGSTSTSTSAR